MQARTTTLLRTLLFIGIVLGAIALIIFMKRSTDQPLTPQQAAQRDSINRIAIPDTTTAPDIDPQSTSTPAQAPSHNSHPTDTLDTGIDLRTPSEAGYEDGYFAGLEDGIAGRERFSYDESSQFPQANQRRNYAEGYRRGYAQGYRDGQDGHSTPEVPSGE